ncbi:MAG: quinone-interacting membrane-bound oxidoreductase complex subunit QmoC [Nitrospiraceae bacterium]|nr:quinone-interacting membrane-bound oxidoreductase complex subunit QmoC [Nitrospiraceae bacterium]
MSERILNPDLGFVKEVISAGGESLKKCYQCATCSVVCNVTPEDKPFPRKEMIQAQWGLKDELFRNPDIWLCHQCSDCTANCPRGAKPGEVLNAIRKLSLQEFSVPGFLAKMVNKPVFLLLLLAIPAAILLASGAGVFPDGKVEFGKPGGFLFSLKYIDPLFTTVAVLALISLGLGIRKYWNAMSEGKPETNVPIGAAITETVKEILAHKRFDKCEVASARSIAHKLVFYSFMGLFVTTILAFIKVILEPQTGYLAYLGHPVAISESFITWLTVVFKIIGNASAAALIIGILLMMSNRVKNAAKAGLGSYYDWLFISLVAGLGITGLLAELLRLANTPAAYGMYLVHLCFVFFLFAYAPFSKMAHMFYRATAMVFEKKSGKA